MSPTYSAPDPTGPLRRVMRIQVPVPLIREMDALILDGRAGYGTRAEFILDAIQERLIELGSGGEIDAGAPMDGGSLPGGPRVEMREPEASSVVRAPSPGETELRPPARGFAIAKDADRSRPTGTPLFGLHNRDYPSMWALMQLARMSSDGPLPADQFYETVSREAWAVGDLLVELERDSGLKCTAGFPTNREKRQSSEGGFRVFAIGDYRAAPGDVWVSEGPLFEWRAAGLVPGTGDLPMIAVTEAGWALLQAVCGESVVQPHSSGSAERFLAYLGVHAPADLAGFNEILRAIGTAGATRQAVLDQLASVWPDWSPNEVSTNAAGYVARAREWGLVEPKQSKGRYFLTESGVERLSDRPKGGN